MVTPVWHIWLVTAYMRLQSLIDAIYVNAKYIHVSRVCIYGHNRFSCLVTPCTTWVASPWGFSEMTIQPARHECHACCPLQAEKPGIQPVVGNMHGTHVEQVVSPFQKILRGSQLIWYSTYDPVYLLGLYPSGGIIQKWVALVALSREKMPLFKFSSESGFWLAVHSKNKPPF